MSFKISQTIHSSSLRDMYRSMNIMVAIDKIVKINFVIILTDYDQPDEVNTLGSTTSTNIK